MFLLKEVGAEFDTEIVNVRAGEQHADSYLSQNPKAKVPALQTDDGQVLTEFQAIAFWIAQTYPDAGLWPEKTVDQARVLEALDYLVASVHMRGFTFVIVPQKFSTDEAVQETLHAYGRSEVDKALRILSGMMGQNDYLLGGFSLADAALLYILNWAGFVGIDVPANLAACHDRLRARHPEA